MGFGAGSTLRLPRPSFRGDLIDDMQAVSEGRISNANNASLITNYSKITTNVNYITRNGAFVASVGLTTVGDTTEKVGYPDDIAVGE
jgi:hypothetical protein